jgi:hypothetical protein
MFEFPEFLRPMLKISADCACSCSCSCGDSDSNWRNNSDTDSKEGAEDAIG